MPGNGSDLSPRHSASTSAPQALSGIDRSMRGISRQAATDGEPWTLATIAGGIRDVPARANARRPTNSGPSSAMTILVLAYSSKWRADRRRKSGSKNGFGSKARSGKTAPCVLVVCGEISGADNASVHGVGDVKRNLPA